MARLPMQLPFGAVYFRKSNPPREHWERDYGVAAQDGMNVFRHWFMWGSIEVAPGEYDFEEYDRQLDLAAKNGIKTVVAELIHAVPDWAVRRWSDARQIRADGRPLASLMGVSSATGGFANNGWGAGVLTLNCPAVKEAAGKFLAAMATRYKGHPGLLGYDIWNECNIGADVDYSIWTKAAFRDWLKGRYGSLKVLARAWNRYSYAEWEDIEPPVQMAPYPEVLDWLQFRRDNAYAQMQWRIDLVRSIDPDCMIAAHGISSAVPFFSANACDDWLAASKVEVYGFTWIQARKGTEPWKSWYGVDIVRGASRGKPFWHAERQGGPLWLQPQVIGRDKEDGRVATPQDIRIWTLLSFAGGARGVLNLRFRPLLDGPLFGAFGAYGMDGSRTPRSDMQSRIAKWANDPAQAGMWEAKPVKGEIGILFVPEAMDFDYALCFERKEKPSPAAMWGAYRGFLETGVQPDWVHIDDIDAYDTIYAPYPIMLTQAHAEKLKAWVGAGGTLVSEACPGYFGDRGHVGQAQPNFGLDAVFGVTQDEVEFMPDIGERIRFDYRGQRVRGGGLLQSYAPTTGTALGHFEGGRCAVVENRFGKGRTLLVGTNPSIGYYETSSEENRHYFEEVFAWTGRDAHVRLDDAQLFARIHEGPAGRFLWLVNPTAQDRRTAVRLSAALAEAKPAACHWPVGGTVSAGVIDVPAKDCVVMRLAD